MEESSGCCAGCLGMIFSLAGAVVGIIWAICEGILKIIGGIFGWIFEKILEIIFSIGKGIWDILDWIDTLCLNAVHLHLLACILIVGVIILLIVLLRVLIRQMVASKIKKGLIPFENKASEYDKNKEYMEEAKEWRNAVKYIKDFAAGNNPYVEELVRRCEGHYEDALYKEAEQHAIQDLKKGEQCQKSCRFLEAAKAYQRAGDIFGYYHNRDRGWRTRYKRDECQKLYKELVAKHVEQMAKQLDDLNW